MKSVKKLLSVLVVVIPVVALGIQLQAARLVRWHDAIHVVNWDETSIVTALMRYIDPFALAMNIIAVVIALIFVWLAKFDDPLKGVKKLLSALAVDVPIIALGIQFQAAQMMRWYHSGQVNDFPYQRTALYYTDKGALAINILALIIVVVACIWIARKDKKAP